MAAACAFAQDEASESSEARETQQRFDIWEYQVEGNTLLENQLVERAVYPYLGPDKTIEDVQAVQQSLETVYRDQGYGTVVVNIPEQDVSEGVVRLAVVEGKVERLRVTGSDYFSLSRIKEEVPALAEGEVPYLPEVQEQLTALNRLTPDRRVTPVLRPGRTPGTVEVELQVEDELPLHGSVELNDRFTRNTSRLRLNASVSYDNLWQRGHSLGLSYQTAPEDRSEVEVFSGTYMFPLPDTNHRVVLYGVRTDSDVATVGTLGVIGSGTLGGARLALTLDPLAERRYFHTLTLGADYKDFDETIELSGAGDVDTPIDYHLFSANYSGRYAGQNSDTRFRAGWNFAFRGLGNSEEEFQEKRFMAKPNFFYLRGSVEHTRALWRGTEAFARIAGQFADSPLINNEQFSIGGVGSVRGYRELEELVDDGVHGTVELRSPSFAAALWEPLRDLHFLAFFDAGQGWLQDPLPGQDDAFTLYSTGVGMRVRAYDGLSADLDWAYPLTDSDDIEAGDGRFHFALEYGF